MRERDRGGNHDEDTILIFTKSCELAPCEYCYLCILLISSIANYCRERVGEVYITVTSLAG